jgi:HAD superfamily hydrolase (TIGR01484 family)
MTRPDTMVVTDLDGTLLDSSSQLRPHNREALARLGERGIPRVVATGRSLFAARDVIGADFPIDYLVFGSGAGICAWPSGQLLRAQHMARAEAERAARCLQRRRLDFMLHFAVPENHCFLYWTGGGANADFERRCQRYERFGTPYPSALAADLTASQLVAIEPPEQPPQLEAIERELADLNVVLTTSPFDHASRWIEIFPREVSKARASAWLCVRLGVAPARVIGVGNDFNDRDLLAWCGRPHVVANAPAALRERYPVVAAHDAGGFAQAVSSLLEPARA